MIFKGYSHFPNNIAPTGPTGPTGRVQTASAVATLPSNATLSDVINQFNSLVQSLQNADILSES